MYRLARWISFAFATVALFAASVKAQTYTCLPDTAEQSDVLRNYVVSLVTGTDSATVALRMRYTLPAVDASKVSVVTTSSVCNQAGAAYHIAVTQPGTPIVSRTLVVVKVSTTRYVVLDPNQHAGEFALHVVFDKNWNDLAGFGS
jgi:hypothetical protein